MGANVSVNNTVQTINNTISNYIEQKGSASASEECLVKIDNVSITKSKNCSVKIENNCIAKASVSLVSVADLATKVYNDFNNDQKGAAAAALFNTSLNNAVQVSTTDISNKVSQLCSAESTNINKIEIKNVVIDQCESVEPLYMTYINTGTAEANCISSLAVKLASEVATKETQKQTGAFSLENIILYVGIFGVLATFLYYIYIIISKYVKTADEIIRINKYTRKDWVGRRNSLINIKHD